MPLRPEHASEAGIRILRAGGSAPAVLNAANEVAVDRFLKGELAFDRIAHLIEEVLSRVDGMPIERLEDVLEADRAAREAACRVIDRRDRHIAHAARSNS